MTLDITTLIFIAIAVFFFLRLRSVLGKRTGRERPSFDPYSERQQSSNDNVVAMPKRHDTTTEADTPDNVTSGKPGTDGKPANPTTDKVLAPIQSVMPDFDGAHFLDGAKMAYEMIVSAYAAGDRKTLKPLLSDDVYAGFEGAISERENRNESVDFTFVGIEKAKILNTEGDAAEIRVTVRFISELISATRDGQGQIIDGSANAVTEVTDIWTFARDPRTSDPNWYLVATEAAD